MTSQRKYKQDPLISCFVPCCKNMAWKSPDKYFFPIPKNKEEWCAAVHKPKVPKGSLYICEDHLNLEEDLQNYNSWKTLHVRGRLKQRVPKLKNIMSEIPHDSPSTSAMVHQVHLPSDGCCSSSSSTIPVHPISSNIDKQHQTVTKADKSIMHVPEKQHKYVQVKPKLADRSTSTIQHRTAKTKTVFVEETLSEEQTPSAVGSTTEISETESSSVIFQSKRDYIGRDFMLNLIKNKPFTYLGVPKKFFWIIEYLQNNSNISSLHIIITLYKLKNSEPFSKIRDIFQVSLTTLWRMYYNALNILQVFFEKFIYWPASLDIKRNLPAMFKTNPQYANVQAIIDCFEIEIEKPSNPVQQALTWSQYKHCNTVKYLISTTPDGFINFISEGYGGRISDMNLLEQSGFLEVVPENCTILADRGFKHLESLISQKSANVLRPPSVTKDTKMTKAEMIQSKVLASLRVHIERVIRRVRLYKLLKPHSVVNNKLINSLDQCVVVACGLINMQSPILKNY